MTDRRNFLKLGGLSLSSAPRLVETSRKRTASARGMEDDDRRDGCGWSWSGWPGFWCFKLSDRMT
jgi:hypothetical protein